jgi:hypothetical protein
VKNSLWKRLCTCKTDYGFIDWMNDSVRYIFLAFTTSSFWEFSPHLRGIHPLTTNFPM